MSDDKEYSTPQVLRRYAWPTAIEATKPEEKSFSLSYDVFGNIDILFNFLGGLKLSNTTKKVDIDFYRMRKAHTFCEMLGLISKDLDSLCFTLGQIKEFARANRGWIMVVDTPTFFLFKHDGKYFLASVFAYSISSYQIGTNLFQVDDVFIWPDNAKQLFIVPKI
ncbi:MAG: hypothetical protein NTZ36_01825 [Candidatus Jorgensenbacteria bacterium]|nr:hypothetical protein [Candidatus Jorgensenbacteria bacterium]